MSKVRKPIILFNASGAATGAWIPTTAGEYGEGIAFGVSWTIASGDTVRIEVTNDVNSDGTAVVGSPAFTASDDFDSTTTGTRIEGSWRFMRAIKVGANGNLKVVGGI